jgi:cytochrome c-type biogenesis protein
MQIGNVGIGLAFIAGLASFLSPCVFSLVPAYLGYLGGRSAASAQSSQSNRWMTFSHGLAFVAGFSLVFILLGVASSALGNLLYDMRTWLARIGGLVVIIFGIHMTGLYRISFLEYDLRPQTVPDRKWGYLSSVMMGVFFSAGWAPCVGPILGAILTVSFGGGSVSQGIQLLAAYSAGMAIPFLIAATQISLVTNLIRQHGKLMHYVEIAMGVVLILVGILLFTGQFERLAGMGFFLEAMDEVYVGQIILVLVIAGALLGLIPAMIARNKGRNFIDWWLFGVVLWPIAIPAALIIKPKSDAEISQA